MTQIDQFESTFRAAAHDVFEYQPLAVSRILVITDLDDNRCRDFVDSLKSYLGGLRQFPAQWDIVGGDGFRTTSDLLELVDKHAPDLVCTYRNLHSRAWKYQHSLGEQLDTLLQRAEVPVLVMPHPDAGLASAETLRDTRVVMAITDHLTNNHALVNRAVDMLAAGGELFLTHIEDAAVYDRYIDAISKIPSIDTDDAREKIARQLLREAEHYIQSCQKVLQRAGVSLSVKSIVRFGHHLAEYRRAIDEHKVNLLVMNTKDDEQLAMHGMAYPLAIELRHLPLLML